MSDRIFTALGAKDEHDALRIVAESNQFLADIKAATGRDTFVGALEIIRGSVALSREVGVLTEKTVEAEQLGTVLAWKSAHVLVPELTEKVAGLEEAGRKRDVKDLIAKGKSDGKLTPATATFWETRNASELEAFLAVAPRVIPGEAKPGAVSSSPSASTKNANGRVADAKNRVYEEVSPTERAQLKKSDPELFNALREDWVAAGKPLDVVTATAN